MSAILLRTFFFSTFVRVNLKGVLVINLVLVICMVLCLQWKNVWSKITCPVAYVINDQNMIFFFVKEVNKIKTNNELVIFT